MAMQTVAPPQVSGEDSGSPEQPARFRRLAGFARNPSTVAVATWLIAMPVAFAAPRMVDMNPFLPAAWALPIGLGLVVALIFLAFCLRWTTDVLAGAAAGLTAAWVTFTLRLALNGTPFGFGGLRGDAGRLAAGATDFADDLSSSGYWIPGQPREYPPLYLMIAGKVADLVDEPGWRLLADVEVVGISLAVVVCFMMWRRLVPSWVAFAISALMIVTYVDARKPYEVITLYVIVPWALATFARPPRGQLHWLPAGVIGGLIVLTYQGWLVFGGLGILVLIVLTWRADRERRRAYVGHLAGVLAVALVVSGWYVVPYFYALLTREHKMISDMYATPSMLENVFPFVGTTPLAVLQAVGLLGLVWLRRSTWWALPLLLLGASAFVYRALMMLSFARSGHTAFAHYATQMVVVVLSAAGVLVLIHAVPRVLERLSVAPPRGTVAALLAVVVAWVTYSFAMHWMPGTQHSSPYTAAAHQEPLPDGGYPGYAPEDGRWGWFPAGPVERAVEGVLGDDPRRVSLAADDRLYSYLPWPGYMTISRFGSGTFMLYDERAAELSRLTRVTDPAQFAQESANTKFGPIDIFILHERNGRWLWRNLGFQQSQFDPALWTIIDDLPGDVVVAIRS